ncbi:MAG: hypothetical protein OQJ96_09925 [Flavobacteriales bacterium]|nr:hypothetical protein [Flavobacteriales bacterium]MCW8913831.1 hypothetical protein [Flavobacteriales bacterium]MCW8937947.1 hypothetical protein [Flavobacteriales bacterium]MCW8939682.1 hypothetical protein [Flavobacteriales bacterium]MCW8968268.1 hypothetical protein [Flavobacteriales bacterium]
MKKLLSYLFIITVLLISGCSWVEYFTVGNKTDTPITVTYELAKMEEGHIFGIFTNIPEAYQLSKSSKIQWENKVELEDLDDNPAIVKVILPPKTVMIFGRLHNDTYESNNQQFINSRDFNFSNMVIEHQEQTTQITKATFDDYFVRKNGYIKFDVE